MDRQCLHQCRRQTSELLHLSCSEQTGVCVCLSLFDRRITQNFHEIWEMCGLYNRNKTGEVIRNIPDSVDVVSSASVKSIMSATAGHIFLVCLEVKIEGHT